MTSQSSQPQPVPGAPQNHESAPDHPAINGRKASVALVIVAIVVIGLALYGIWKRHHNDDSAGRDHAARCSLRLP